MLPQDKKWRPIGPAAMWLILTFCAAGCAVPPPLVVGRPVYRPFAALDSTATQAVAFERLVIGVPIGTVVGQHHDGLLKLPQQRLIWGENLSIASDEFRVMANEELRESGYRVPGRDDLVFARTASAPARYEVGGVLDSLEVNTYGPLAGDYARATVFVEWQVLDTLRNEVVWTSMRSASAREEGGSLRIVQFALLDSFRDVLSDSAFLSLVAIREGEGELEARYIANCPTPVGSALPDGLEELFRATVTLSTDGEVGSGVVISETGLVLTAAHVVTGLDQVAVKFRNGLQLDAAVLSVDTIQDVAIVRLPGSGHTCVGTRTDALGVGSTVYAVGAPTGEALAFSVSQGVVSGYRVFDGSSFLQTDASLNRGNSGGPLFDAEGRLAGIVSWKLIGIGVEGLGFGVPVSAVTESLSLRFQR